MLFLCTFGIGANAATIKVGGSTTLTAPSVSGTNPLYSWTSSPSGRYVSLSSTSSRSIVVRGESAGTATITCTVRWQTYNSTTKQYVYETSNEKTQTYTITVQSVEPTSITLSSTSATMTIGDTKQLTATVYPSGVSQSVTWSVYSGSSYASVSSSGLVTAKAAGTAVIRATSTANSSVYKDCTVSVTQTTPPTSISLNYNSISLTEGNTRQLTATVSPSDASQSVTWAVYSGSNYASVSSSGLVTAKLAGTATIRATSTSNSSIYNDCTVTVLAQALTPGTWSGNTLTIGGSATNSTYVVPFSNNWNQYSTAQLLYSPSEIGKSGTISSIAFQAASTANVGISMTSLNIYLGHKSSKFSSANNYVSSGLTLVYSGSPTIGASTGWQTFTFNQGTFNYNGTDNLVVVIARKGDYTNLLKYYCYSGNGYTLYRCSDDDANYANVYNTSYSYTETTSRPSIRMVFAESTSPTSISLNTSGVNLEAGGTKQLTATVSPSSASQSVTWSVVSGSAVASVSSSGLVTAKAAGTATIRATSTANSSVYKDCTVTVTEPVLTPGTWSGNTVTIGDNATSSTSNAPYNNYWTYSTTQILYSPAEIGKSGTINSIAFKVASASSFTTTALKVYLGHKSSLFSSTTDYMTSSNLTLVYDGTPTLGASLGWETLTFNKGTFDYNGTDNLVVVVAMKSSNYDTTLGYYCYTGSGYVLSRGSDNTTGYGDITYTSYGYSTSTERPSIRLGFGQSQGGTTDIEINATNFPDANFRSYLLSRSYGSDGVLTQDEINGVTYLFVNNKQIGSLKGIEYFTALTELYCYGNQLTTLDVSKNTALTYLSCAYNQLTTLDGLKNTALTNLSCYANNLKGVNMDNLIAGLCKNDSNSPYIIYVASSTEEGNVCTKAQVAAIKAKGWKPLYYDGTDWKEYEGSEEEVVYSDGDTFSATNSDGVTLHYEVKSTANKTVYVYAASEATHLSIPPMVKGFTVTDIATEFMESNKTLQSLVIPYTVTKIGSEAFRSCTGLTTLYIPTSVTSIRPSSFEGCTNLREVVVSDDNPVYDSRDNCNGIIETATNSLIFGNQYTVIPQSVTAIKSYTAQGDVVIPSQITLIAEDAFDGMEEMTSVTIPAGVTAIGDYAFCDCIGLTSVTSLITSPFAIDESVFGFDKNHGQTLTATLYVPAGTKALYEATEGWNVFTNIVEMEPTIEDEPQTIEVGGIYYKLAKAGTVFDGIVQTVYQPDEEVAVVWAAESGHEYSGDIVIPSSISYEGKSYDVVGIGVCAFAEYKGWNGREIKSIVLPNSVIAIGEKAFVESTTLQRVEIPNSVKYILEYAFADCESLSEIVSYIQEPFEIQTSVFRDIANNATLYVPAGTKALYEATEGWNVFQNIVELDAEQPTDEPDDVEVTDISQMENAIYVIGAYEGVRGGRMNLSVRIKNSVTAEGFDFDLILPTGFTVAYTPEGNIDAEVSGERADDNTLRLLEPELSADGRSLHISASPTNKNAFISGNDGEVMIIGVMVDADVSIGDHSVTVMDAEIHDREATYPHINKVVSSITVCDKTLGDANGNNNFNGADYTSILHYLWDRPDPSFVMSAADVNCDGYISVSDLTAWIRLYLNRKNATQSAQQVTQARIPE